MAISAAREQFSAERVATVLDKVEAAPLNERLEAMKRAVERLQAMSADANVWATKAGANGLNTGESFVATASAYAAARSALA